MFINTIKVYINFTFILILLLIFMCSIYICIYKNDIISLQGNIVFNINRKQIFYNSSSFIEKIFIKNGDFVFRGQPLLLFNSSKYKTDLYRILWQIRYYLITSYRLFYLLDILYNFSSYNCLINTQKFNFIIYKYLYYNQLFNILDIEIQLFNFYISFYLNVINIYTVQTKQLISEFLFSQLKINLIYENILLLKNEFINKYYYYLSYFDNFDNLFLLKIDLQKYENYIIDEQLQLIFLRTKMINNYFKLSIFFHEHSLKFLKEYHDSYFYIFNLESHYISTLKYYKDTIVISPIDGLILFVGIHDMNISLNFDIHPIIEIIPYRNIFMVESFVSSKHIYNFHLGSHIQFYINNYKKRNFLKFHGIISDISSVSSLNNLNNNYRILITIDDNLLYFIPGSSVNIYLINHSQYFYHLFYKVYYLFF